MALTPEQRERYKAQQRERYQNDPELRERIRARSRERNAREYRRLKNELLDKLGHECARCGFSDERALQFDHINGGGVKQQREMPGWRNRLGWMLENPDEVQVLCANCNSIKRIEQCELPPGAVPKFGE